MGKKSQVRYSKSSLDTYRSCPRKFYFNKFANLESRTDLPRICGVAVHEHVRQLYKPSSKPDQTFYYGSKAKFIGAWFHRWQRTLEKWEGRINDFEPDKSDQFSKVGCQCVAKYWDDNESEKKPLEVEKRYESDLTTDVRLVGIFDQVRSVSDDFIRAHRPELFENDILNDQFDKVVIWDIKTDYLSYGSDQLSKDLTLEKKLRSQYELHEYYQATMYTWLYFKAHGKWPIGFVWHHLRSGKIFFTFRTSRHLDDLFDFVNHVKENVDANSFPKFISNQCSRCDYVNYCNEDHPIIFVAPEDISSLGTNPDVENSTVKVNPRQQLRLNIKIKRTVKPDLKPVKPKEQVQNTLFELPWNKIEGEE